MTEAIELSHQSKGLVIASWRCVSLNIWRRGMDPPGLRVARVHLQQMRSRYPQGYFSMVLFPEQGRDIKIEIAESIRTDVTQIVRESEGAVRASAIAIEGGGFFAAAMRTAGSGITLVARPAYPVKFLDSVEAACAWLATQPLPSSASSASGASSASAAALRFTAQELTAAARAAVAVAS